MKNTLEISDSNLLRILHDEILHADADMLAMIATFVFGVRCSAGSQFVPENGYTFEYDPEIDPEECEANFGNVLRAVGRS